MMRRAEIGGGSRVRALRAWLDLFRISNLPTVWTNIGAAWWLSAAGDARNVSGLWCVLAGGSLLYMAGMALNDAFDASRDRRERPERPIPSGRLGSGAAWTAGGVFLIVGAGILIAAAAGGTVIGGLVAAILAYNWLHKGGAWTAALMGLCRVLLWWLPATLPGHQFNEAIFGWSALLFGYIIGVTLIARAENAAGTRRWDAGHRIGRLLVLMPLIGAIILSEPLENWPAIPFLVVAVIALRAMEPGQPRSVGRGVGRLLGAMPLIDAMAVAPATPSVLLASGSLLCWLLQRKVAAS